ncbi:BQ5605_C017g08484 [Microbotryum silenes-dioicae]|uniref:BQ5605_C017g08484 protein n=1 Tax=Microbotryum silenes-dioicae TaxID=796604 RepID=A0A2X0LZG7_9BASI|nr:BQ5605_C017g08484 [Microbotryum silenes-dioicae]
MSEQDDDLGIEFNDVGDARMNVIRSATEAELLHNLLYAAKLSELRLLQKTYTELFTKTSGASSTSPVDQADRITSSSAPKGSNSSLFTLRRQPPHVKAAILWTREETNAEKPANIDDTGIAPKAKHKLRFDFILRSEDGEMILKVLSPQRVLYERDLRQGRKLLTRFIQSKWEDNTIDVRSLYLKHLQSGYFTSIFAPAISILESLEHVGPFLKFRHPGRKPPFKKSNKHGAGNANQPIRASSNQQETKDDGWADTPDGEDEDQGGNKEDSEDDDQETDDECYNEARRLAYEAYPMVRRGEHFVKRVLLFHPT